MCMQEVFEAGGVRETLISSWPGREDMDVRMLGGGRPFTLELVNAKARHPPAGAFAAMQEALNASGVGVEVRKLQAMQRASAQLIKACPSVPELFVFL